MNSQTIRKAFLDFFAERGHTIRPSESLIPSADPTLIFTSAGMVPFKALWTDAPLEFTRAASSQKCLRVGGKDSDLENVGRTLRHHSFFEMLGNFSFGDYFKKEAIEWAWEFVIEVMELTKEQLWVSVFQDDTEAFEIWKKTIGIPPEKIVRLGEKDNFWGPAGSSGPCGPCSEIYFDRGPEFGCGKPDCRPGCECERYFEFWNLVFPQFYQEESGERRQLERRGIDTGMGLERLTLLSQGVVSNYDTDLFLPIINALRELSPGARKSENREACHVIADHIRALTFVLAENILPSNEGRGYVMRRLLRRAARFGRKLGLDKPFLFQLVPAVVEVMREPYPELLEAREHVGRIIRAEEERFGDTLSLGLEKLDEIAERLRTAGKTVIPGEDVFKLSDTYGFPPELTDEVAREKGMAIDWPAFERALEEQRERGRMAWKGLAQREILPVYRDLRKRLPQTIFSGYEKIAFRTRVRAIMRDGETVAAAGEDEAVNIVLAETPFYAEAGGQVGDSGVIQTSNVKMRVDNTFSPIEGLIIHQGRILSGLLSEGDQVEALVDQERRKAIQRHHTATHLLQQALREVVGEHITQAGSYVGPDYFRFDFTHYEALTPEEVKQVEERVNRMTIENDPVRTFHLSLRDAKKQGALAFFGEKYGERVRMIDIGGYSRELCGGTHVHATGEIGFFTILSECSVASGVRRIEAICGEKAYQQSAKIRGVMQAVTERLKTNPDRLLSRLEKLTTRVKTLENEKKELLKKQAGGDLAGLMETAKTISDFKVVVANLGDVEMGTLRSIADELKHKLVSGIAVLGSVTGKTVHLVAIVTGDLVKRGYHAGEIIKTVAILVGGSGGGRPDLAQAGGKEPDKLPQALRSVPEIIREIGK
ncbi:MAG: alanine--tRNA ligase [Candidatus Euphemobacter frigidus]|nr:alanine--tRNA ligase [Candidatus Euphemobacter frigidus]MDP8275305.1 alanine--tRNA ligase [Candidatus Euphemobacter frigidus]